jgi:hypothetical protein
LAPLAIALDSLEVYEKEQVEPRELWSQVKSKGHFPVFSFNPEISHEENKGTKVR